MEETKTTKELNRLCWKGKITKKERAWLESQCLEVERYTGAYTVYTIDNRLWVDELESLETRRRCIPPPTEQTAF
jgi:hypothetical protein